MISFSDRVGFTVKELKEGGRIRLDPCSVLKSNSFCSFLTHCLKSAHDYVVPSTDTGVAFDLSCSVLPLLICFCCRWQMSDELIFQSVSGLYGQQMIKITS